MVKGLKFIITITAIIISVSLSALCAVPSEVISVPAAGVLNNGDINVSLYNSMSLSPASDPVAFSYNLGATYGLLGIANVSLHMYTYKDYAGQVQFSLMKDEDSKPALDIGIKNITYRRYIDEGGGSDSISAGLADNAYPNRSSDMLSAYIVATKDFGRAGRYTLGIGRGEFVGYDYGRFLSSVVLFEDYAVAGNMANEFMFGLFGGFEIPLLFNTSLKADFDGRDVNAGLCYNFKQVAVNAALTHIELFRSDNADLNPRVELGLAYTFSPFGTPKVEEE